MIKKVVTNGAYFVFASLVSLGILLTLWLSWLFLSLPTKSEIQGCLVTKQYKVNLCPSDSTYTKLKSVPTHLVDILILSEDASFWDHDGFDWIEVQRSIETNLESGRFKRGGSTLTQQLAKNLFLTNQKSLLRKFNEALITYRLESYLTKREILEKYLNVVEFGPNVFGINVASKIYFQKQPADLLPEESAFLVMLLPNPAKYSQSFYRKKLTPYAFSRVNTLLKRAYLAGRLTDSDYQIAKFRAQYLFNSDIPAWDGVDSNEDNDESLSDSENSESENIEGTIIENLEI